MYTCMHITRGYVCVRIYFYFNETLSNDNYYCHVIVVDRFLLNARLRNNGHSQLLLRRVIEHHRHCPCGQRMDCYIGVFKYVLNKLLMF